LALLRETAPPSFRDATIPRRGRSAPLGAIRTVTYRPWTRVALSKTRWNSPRRLTRRAFEKRCPVMDGWHLPARGSGAPVRRRSYSDDTVSRLRPFARRRFRTSRPFLVLMRTRKPCVRLRRRRFGWNVRFMMSDPLLALDNGGET
jgi:hypothetical protein